MSKVTTHQTIISSRDFSRREREYISDVVHDIIAERHHDDHTVSFAWFIKVEFTTEEEVTDDGRNH